MRDYRIFHCSKDDDWIVCVDSLDDEDVVLGVADCPDELTAKAVLRAMRVAQEARAKDVDEPD